MQSAIQPAKSPIQGVRNFVYIAYMDDAGSTGRNLADKNAPFQIISAVLMKDDQFDTAELVLSAILDEIPFDIWPSFEFHAVDMWAGNPPFDKVKREDATCAIRQCLELIAGMNIPIVYGAVDKKKLSEQLFASASPSDMAFRACIGHIEEWMKTSAPSDLAILIADNSEQQRNEMQNVFHQHRRRVRSTQHNRGRLEHLLDDMYFGDSKHSLGIQLVDVCNFVIQRHLCGKEDTEYLYRIIEKCIFKSTMIPSEGI